MESTLIKEFQTLAENLDSEIWSEFLEYDWSHKTRKDLQDEVLKALAAILPKCDIQSNKERISSLVLKKIVAKGDDARWCRERTFVKEVIGECLYFARIELESEVAKLEAH